MLRRSGPVRVGDAPPPWWRPARYAAAAVLIGSACACVYWFPAGSPETPVTLDQAVAAVFTVACVAGATLLLAYEWV